MGRLLTSLPIRLPALRGGGTALAAAALLLALGAVYLQTAGFPFLAFDDGPYLTDNQVVRQGLTAEGVEWAFTTLHAGFWHPLTWLSHMADVSLFGPWAGGHHLVNVLLHLAAALSLFLALRALTGEGWPSLLAAALWSLHPLRVESVAWVAERKDLLAGLFFFLGLRAYAAYARAPRPASYLGVLACGALAFLSKPTAVTFPFVLLLLDGWPLGRFGGAGEGGWRSRLPRLLGEKLPLLVMAAGVSVATWWAHHLKGGIRPDALGERLANAAASYGGYLAKTVWPAKLAVLYPYPEGGPSTAAWAAAAALLLLLTLLAVGQAERRPYLLVGWLWFTGMLVPSIGLVPQGTQAMADRFTHLPHAGLFLALAWGAAEAARKFPRARAGLVASLLALLLAWAGLSWRQVSVWRDSETLFRHAREVTEGNWLMAHNLGTVLAREGRDEEAERFFRQAIAEMPGFDAPYGCLGRLLHAQGREEEAFAFYRQALALQGPGAIALRLEVGNALLEAGRDSEARKEFERVLLDAPGEVEALFGLAEALSRLGDPGAEAAWESARRAMAGAR